MYRMYGMTQGARDGGAAMHRMYGQIFAPAISALPPSLVVVCRGAMDGKERRMPMGVRHGTMAKEGSVSTL